MMPDSKKIAALIVSKASPSEEGKGEKEYDAEEGLDATSEEIMAAFEKKDAKGLKVALKSFFEQCDAMPHEEGEHTEEESDSKELE
jgi:hypothetical protein